MGAIPEPNNYEAQLMNYIIWYRISNGQKHDNNLNGSAAINHYTSMSGVIICHLVSVTLTIQRYASSTRSSELRSAVRATRQATCFTTPTVFCPHPHFVFCLSWFHTSHEFMQENRSHHTPKMSWQTDSLQSQPSVRLCDLCDTERVYYRAKHY